MMCPRMNKLDHDTPCSRESQELPCSIVPVRLRRFEPQMLALPDQKRRKREYKQPNSANGIEDVWQANCCGPCGHAENDYVIMSQYACVAMLQERLSQGSSDSNTHTSEAEDGDKQWPVLPARR